MGVQLRGIDSEALSERLPPNPRLSIGKSESVDRPTSCIQLGTHYLPMGMSEHRRTEESGLQGSIPYQSSSRPFSSSTAILNGGDPTHRHSLRGVCKVSNQRESMSILAMLQALANQRYNISISYCERSEAIQILCNSRAFGLPRRHAPRKG